jgi:hypothetical protein
MFGAAQPLTPFNHLTGRPPTLHQGSATGAGPLLHLGQDNQRYQRDARWLESGLTASRNAAMAPERRELGGSRHSPKRSGMAATSHFLPFVRQSRGSVKLQNAPV